MRASAAPRPVTLRISCDPAPQGVLSLELWVPQAFALKDFDYDDFEGPDAAALDRELSVLTLGGEAAPTKVSHAAAGWYSGEDPDTFVFGVSERSRAHAKLAAFLGALRADPTTLLWIQKSLDASARVLSATFALDAATVARVHATVDPCVAATATPQSKPKQTK